MCVAVHPHERVLGKIVSHVGVAGQHSCQAGGLREVLSIEALEPLVDTLDLWLQHVPSSRSDGFDRATHTSIDLTEPHPVPV